LPQRSLHYGETYIFFLGVSPGSPRLVAKAHALVKPARTARRPAAQ
jgi:allophanate hydrolase subunit 1